MLIFKNLKSFLVRIDKAILVVASVSILFLVSCNAQLGGDQLSVLRDMTKDGKLPPEAVVLNIESRNSGNQIGTLARLLRARIRLENGNPIGAAQLLDSPDFERKTSVGDYALWLRGKALLEAKQYAPAEKVFSELVKRYPNSLRTKDARILWANSAMGLGQYDKVGAILKPLTDQNNPEALMILGNAAERKGDILEASNTYRRIYFYGAGSKLDADAEKWLTARGESLEPRSADELRLRAERLLKNGYSRDASKTYEKLVNLFPGKITPETQLKRLTAASRAGYSGNYRNAFNAIPNGAPQKAEAYLELAKGYARAKLWNDARITLDQMRSAFPNSELTPKAFVEVGSIAGDQKRRLDENYFMKAALAYFPTSIEVTKAHFELAWDQHNSGNFETSSSMLTDHLARYVDKDNSYRGQAGYWAARDSEKAGKINEACALYDGVAYRYGSNWYGDLALKQVGRLRNRGRCLSPVNFPKGSAIPKAVANLKVVTAAAETATPQALKLAEKSDQLSTIGLFDWAIDELNEAKKTADNSPKINLALARHYRFKGNNVRALLAMAASYPDYAQMFPEEMSKEEWSMFYPLSNWKDINYWAKQRNLDPYVVAGLIRQETIFNPRAASHANAYGLMQLLVPTARTMARKYSSTPSSSISAYALYNPKLNIELGTAYMREQLNKYGRIEYMAAAYNAGPGRVARWRVNLSPQMDEFVEEIPFRETRGYVKGIIRNTAQYRRLYDANGNFKPNVGTRPIRAQIDSVPAEQFARENPEIDVERSAR